MQIEFKHIEHISTLLKVEFGMDLTSEINGFIQIYAIEKHGLFDTIDVFRTHQKIQNDITKSNAVEGYEELLKSLDKEVLHADVELIQLNIVTEKSGYIFFTDLSFNKLYGVLKMNSQQIHRNTELNDKNELRGTWTNRKFYLEGIELN